MNQIRIILITPILKYAINKFIQKIKYKNLILVMLDEDGVPDAKYINISFYYNFDFIYQLNNPLLFKKKEKIINNI